MAVTLTMIALNSKTKEIFAAFADRASARPPGASQSRKRVGHLSALLARSKARTADHFKTDECSIVVELGHEGKFVAQIKRLRSKPGCL